jgi:hypothetical protein
MRGRRREGGREEDLGEKLLNGFKLVVARDEGGEGDW